MKNPKINIESLDAIVCDFDGVLTNNLVHLNSLGEEFVSCNRLDGLAVNALKKINLSICILSTEKDKVVAARGRKLGIPVIQDAEDKVNSIKIFADNEGFKLSRILYIGNDLNDLNVMKICGYSACPADSHKKIKQIATFNLTTKGGAGVLRELIEEILELDLIEILYKE